jgi:hypothetical protein
MVYWRSQSWQCHPSPESESAVSDNRFFAGLDDDALVQFRKGTGLDPSGEAFWNEGDFSRAAAWFDRQATDPGGEANRLEAKLRDTFGDDAADTALGYAAQIPKDAREEQRDRKA